MIHSLTAKIILIFSMLIMGACGLMYEYVLSVMGNYLMGTTHEQMFIIIGIMLFAMGMGALLQRVIKKNLLDFFIILEIFLGIMGGISGLTIYAAHAHWESMSVVLYSFAFSIGGLLGMEIPILIRINEEYSDSLRANLSEILTVDYVGSLMGAIIFTYVFLVFVPLTSISFILGLANLFLASIAFLFFSPLVKKKKIIFIFLLIAYPVLILGLLYSGKITLYLEQKYYRDPIILSKTTRFQHLILTQRKERLELYINGHLQFSSQDEGIYHEYLVHVPMSLADSRSRVLILGGGDGLAAREVLKYPDVREIVLVDIDPEVTKLSRTQPELIRLNGGSLLDARVAVLPAQGVSAGDRVPLKILDTRATKKLKQEMKTIAQVYLVHIDADVFVSKADGLFDVVIIDFPDPGMLELAKLYSLDFYKSLNRILSPQAMISIQSGSPIYAKKAFVSIGKTLNHAGFRSLPYRGNVPSFFGEWGWHLAWNSSLQHSELLARLRSLSTFAVETSFLTPEMAAASFVFGKNQLITKSEVRINTKMMPILVQYYRESWKKW